MTITVPVSDADLLQAIRLQLSSCFAAMSIANALGGSPIPAWGLARKHRLAELVSDALDRGLDVRSLKSAVDEIPFVDCSRYLKLREEIGGRPDFPQ